MTPKNDIRMMVIFPEDLVREVDEAATSQDRNRSQWIRAAAREKLKRDEEEK